MLEYIDVILTIVVSVLSVILGGVIGFNLAIKIVSDVLIKVLAGCKLSTREDFIKTMEIIGKLKGFNLQK